MADNHPAGRDPAALRNTLDVQINPATEDSLSVLSTKLTSITTLLTTISGDVASDPEDGSLGTLALIATAIKNEDAVHVSGDAGIQALTVRQDTPAALGGTDGDYQPSITDALGHVWTREGYRPNYENNTLNVAQVGQLPTIGSELTWSIDQSAALEASTVTKAAEGNLRSAFVRIDSTAATDDYYIQFYNAASLPANGAVTFITAPYKVQHVTGTDSEVAFDFLENGINATTGIVVGISTTEFTKTIAGAIASFVIRYK